MLGPARTVGRGKVELAFADEHELAELAEALEGCRLADRWLESLCAGD